MITANVTGARLAFVVRKLEGTVMREKVKMVCVKKESGRSRAQWEMKTEQIEEDAGYMVYFPRGHVVRIPSEKLLEFYKLNVQPRIINMDGLTDPNTPLGRMMLAQDEEQRRGAFIDMERAVIALACAKTGNQLMPEQIVVREAA